MTARGRHPRAGHDRPLHEASGGPGAAHAKPDAAARASTKAGLEKRVEDLGRQLEELEKRLATTEAERDEYLADLRRLAADFDNYRKRAARDQERLVARAHERLVKELLPVLDDLERALEAAAQHEAAVGAGAPPLEDGVRLVERQLRETLRREGLVEIETNGRFDPHVHEALLSQPSEQEEGAVIEVLQRGYRLGDRVLRPARVVISQGAPTKGGTPSSTPQEETAHGDAD